MPGNTDKQAQSEPGGLVFDREPVELLLVDDEKGYIDVLANRLTRRNFRATKAYSGTEAIRVLRKKDFEVVVLDLKMEDMDGVEVLRILKKMDPDLVVIMLTGHGSAEAAREGIKSGAFDYLTKPCEFGELVEKIKAAATVRRNLK